MTTSPTTKRPPLRAAPIKGRSYDVVVWNADRHAEVRSIPAGVRDLATQVDHLYQWLKTSAGREAGREWNGERYVEFLLIVVVRPRHEVPDA